MALVIFKLSTTDLPPLAMVILWLTNLLIDLEIPFDSLPKIKTNSFGKVTLFINFPFRKVPYTGIETFDN